MNKCNNSNDPEQIKLEIEDSSSLTSQQLAREILHLKELIFLRLNSMDKAIILLQNYVDRQPTTAAISAAYTERFEAINRRFLEQREATTISIENSKEAVNAAGAAAKEAVSTAFSAAKEAVIEQNKANTLASNKQEMAFTKQIDQIGTIINTQAKSVDDRIGDTKNRLTVLESRISLPVQNNNNLIAIVVGIILVVGSILFTFSIDKSVDKIGGRLDKIEQLLNGKNIPE